MLSEHVQHYLTQHLRGLISSDDAKEVLRLIDDSGALVTEFDKVLGDVSQKIPGLAINFEKLLNSDEIECDPLISQGNLALIRLDTIYYQAFEAWKKSGGDLHRFKRITKAENPATYSGSTEKHERTDENYPPDAQLLNQVVNITLSAFRIQATITHRREQLQSGQPIGALNRPKSQPEASARNAAQSDSLPETNPDIIPADEILDFDDLSAPIDGKFPLLIRGVNKFGILKGYDQLEPLTKTQPLVQQTSAISPAKVAFRSAKGRSATDSVSPQPREENPITLAQPRDSSPPTSHQPQVTSHSPPFHKRE